MIVGTRTASMVLPVPGGPASNTLCRPAAAMSKARLAASGLARRQNQPRSFDVNDQTRHRRQHRSDRYQAGRPPVRRTPPNCSRDKHPSLPPRQPLVRWPPGHKPFESHTFACKCHAERTLDRRSNHRAPARHKTLYPSSLKRESVRCQRAYPLQSADRTPPHPS